VVLSQVPPKDNIDRVPLGASSASMYPGYSPADHIYGEAAQEFGEHAAEMKRKGMDLKLDPSGPQYAVGQNRKPRRLTQTEGAHTGSVSASEQDGKDEDGDGEPMEGVEQSTDMRPLFVIDSKPTPIADLGEIQKQRNKANDKAKRRVSFKEDQEVLTSGTNSCEQSKAKKIKLGTAEPPSAANPGSVPQEDDIAAEVEARLKAKEEKRKRKEEKKRKRESGDSGEGTRGDSSATLGDMSAETSSVEKPKKKMPKKVHDEVEGSVELSFNMVGDKEPTKDNKKKKKSGATNEQEAAPSTGAESDKPKKEKKKKKKEKRKDSAPSS
jgi:hypothetical protein